MMPTRRLVLAWLAFALPLLILAAVLWHGPGSVTAQQRTYTWKAQSAWPATNFLHKSAQELVKMIDEMSAGRLKIDMQAAGTVVPAFEVLDAVNRGLIDAAHAWPGYWVGKNSAAGLFAPGPGGPFGMDREEYLSWLFAGGGLEMYNDMLQKDLGMNVISFYTTSLPYWEPLGWFKRPFAGLDELRKMKFRTSGLGLEMMRTMGIPVVTLSGGEVIPALERGVVDGAEWALPSHDILMGFQNVTKNYYMPDLRQPASYQDVLINRKKWDELSPDLKAIVKYACMAEIIRMTAVSVDQDAKAVEELEKKHGVQMRTTPPEILKAEIEAIDKVYEAEAKKNPLFAKVLKSQRDFASRAVPHATRIRPPIETIVAHYWGKK